LFPFAASRPTLPGPRRGFRKRPWASGAGPGSPKLLQKSRVYGLPEDRGSSRRIRGGAGPDSYVRAFFHAIQRGLGAGGGGPPRSPKPEPPVGLPSPPPTSHGQGRQVGWLDHERGGPRKRPWVSLHAFAEKPRSFPPLPTRKRTRRIFVLLCLTHQPTDPGGTTWSASSDRGSQFPDPRGAQPRKPVVRDPPSWGGESRPKPGPRPALVCPSLETDTSPITDR